MYDINRRVDSGPKCKPERILIRFTLTLNAIKKLFKRLLRR
jgi:hypothetical protein